MFRKCAIALLFASLASAASAAPSRGGSNYGWFGIEGCNREPYGVVANYHIAEDVVKAQLTEMAANGQRRLRIGIFHARNANTGTVIPSAGGNLPEQQRRNLLNLMKAAKEAGFVEIIVGFFPLLDNAPNTWTGTIWTAWHEEYFQENWNLVFNLMPVMRAANVKFLVDLGNEGTPAQASSVLWKQYASKLWWNFSHVFGLSETVGFSVPTNSADRIAVLPEIYGANPPYLLDFHLYGAEAQQLRAIDAGLARIRYPQGIVIGESYYNDATSASEIAATVAGMGRAVFFTLQWPLTRNSTCSDVNVAPPSTFSNYISQGL